MIEKLRDSWSPEQIAGRLREVDHPGDPSWHICMETIYQFIYKEKTDKTKQGLLADRILDKLLSESNTAATITDHEKPLWEYLRRKQVRRRKKGGRKSQRVRIPDRVSIHDRPKEIDERVQFGHWEGDSIVGLGHRNGLHTEYERVCSLTRFERLKRITAGEAARAAQKIFAPLPDHAKGKLRGGAFGASAGFKIIRHLVVVVVCNGSVTIRKSTAQDMDIVVVRNGTLP